jgi:hypothetical protein
MSRARRRRRTPPVDDRATNPAPHTRVDAPLLDRPDPSGAPVRSTRRLAPRRAHQVRVVADSRRPHSRAAAPPSRGASAPVTRGSAQPSDQAPRRRATTTPSGCSRSVATDPPSPVTPATPAASVRERRRRHRPRRVEAVPRPAPRRAEAADARIPSTRSPPHSIDRRAQQIVVARQHRAHHIQVLLPASPGIVDLDEQEGHGARRPFNRHPDTLSPPSIPRRCPPRQRRASAVTTPRRTLPWGQETLSTPPDERRS